MRNEALLKDQGGVVLVLALIMLLVATLIGISAIGTATFETNISANQRLYNQAFYAADGGIEDFLSTAPTRPDLLSNPAPSGNYYTEPKTVGTNMYNMTWTRLGNVTEAGGNSCQLFQVVSVGTAPNFPAAGRVTVEAIVEVATPSPGYD